MLQRQAWALPSGVMASAAKGVFLSAKGAHRYNVGRSYQKRIEMSMSVSIEMKDNELLKH